MNDGINAMWAKNRDKKTKTNTDLVLERKTNCQKTLRKDKGGMNDGIVMWGKH